MKPILINNLELAKSQDKVSGKIDARCCDNLAGALISSNQRNVNIVYTLAPATERLHIPSLHLTIDAALPVQCQRCLESMEIKMSLAFDYLVGAAEPDDLEERDDVDWLEVSQTMDLSALVEDELLLALPMAPTHKADCSHVSHESGEKPNPFAVLKDLIK